MARRNRYGIPVPQGSYARPMDPGAALDPIVGAMQSQLAGAQRQAAVAIADEKRLRQWVDYHQGNAAAWEKRAMLAVRAGDDGMARQALERKARCEEEGAQYETHWRDQKRSVDALRASLTALGERIQHAHRERNSLAARAAAAHARMSIAHTMAQLNGLSTGTTLNRMEDRVVQMEAEAEAAADLNGVDDSLEARFRALEAGSTDDALLSLKAKMGLGPLALSS